MAAPKQQIALVIPGGRPWGFSLKGGLEHNKPLVISKLEKKGKGELGGLMIGDVVLVVNDVPVGGYRDKAVQLVRSSGRVLTITVERNVLFKEAGVSMFRGSCNNDSYPSNFHYRSNVEQDKQTSLSEQTRYDITRDPFQANFHERTRDQFKLSSMPSEHFIQSPVDGATYQGTNDEDQVNFLLPKRSIDMSKGQYNDHYTTDSNDSYVKDHPNQPVVKLRTRKARDRGIAIERPRSWHASHFDFEHNQEDMRSPESNYAGDHGSQVRYRHPPVSQPVRRRSKGWNESGELKSVYKQDLGESKESLYSGSSHRSHKSARLSVSSSKSSNTMSSSRASLDYLTDDSPMHCEINAQKHPQILLTSGASKYKHFSSSQPQTGIVSQQRNIFEKLSQESTLPGSNPAGSRENLSRIGKNQRIPSDASDRKFRSSPLSSTGSGGQPSVSSPPSSFVAEKENFPHRKRSYDHSDHGYGAKQRETHEATSRKIDDARSIASLDRRLHTAEKLSKADILTATSPPSPPRRDESSISAVRSYHSQTQLASLVKSTKEAEVTPQSKQGNLSQMSKSKSSTLLTNAISQNCESLERQERMFGVVSVGKDTNVVSASVYPNAKDFENKLLQNTSTSVDVRHTIAKFEPTKLIQHRGSCSDSTTTNDEAKDRKLQSNYGLTVSGTAEHRKTASSPANDSKVKGKYGAVWKTPQNHQRARSGDFSTVLHDWSARECNEPTKLSVFEADNQSEFASEMRKEPENVSKAPDLSKTSEANKKVNDLPAKLKSLEHTQHGDRTYKYVEPKTTDGDYDKIWYVEPSKSSKESDSYLPIRPWSAHNNHTQAKNSYNSWKSQFKEVDLDEPIEDSCPPDSYVYNIKDMSSKVLRVTSFTRKDLDVVPVFPSLQEKRKHFQFPSSNPNTEADADSTRSRSRSHCSDVEEDEGVAILPGAGKPRPKSAGVLRASNRHAPVMRTSVVPTCNRPASYYARKSESLPRNSMPSFDSDDCFSPTLVNNKASSMNKSSTLSHTSPSDVTLSPAADDKKKRDTRSAVLDFITRKTGISFEDDTIQPVASDNPTPSRQSPKKHSDIAPLCDDQISPIHNSHEDGSYTISNHAQLHNDINRSNSYIVGQRNKMNSHSQSPSSLLDEEDFHVAPHDHTSSITSGERSLSIDNLTDSGLDMSRASPSDNLSCDLSRDKDQSLLIETLGKRDVIKPLPRKHPKQHRQRYSNSSSASSATTISTLSSFSSSSSASVGRFPAVGEEAEQLHGTVSSTPDIKQSTPGNKQTPLRAPIDTGTYRVAKRKSVSKLNGSKTKSPEVYCSTAKVTVGASEQVGALDSGSSPNKENVDTQCKSPVNKDTTAISESRKNRQTMMEVQENVYKIIEKVRRSTSLQDPDFKRSSSFQIPPPPPPTLHPLDDAAEQLLKDIAQQRCARESMPFVAESIVSSGGKIKEKNRNQNTTTTSADTSAHFHDKDKKSSPTGDASKGSGDHSEDDASRSGLLPSGGPESEVAKKTEVLEHERAGQLSVHSPLPEVSSLPLLPDVSLLPDSLSTSLQQEHPDLTRDIIKGDQTLAQVLTASSRKALDYMEGILPQPSHAIVKEGMRYRRRKPLLNDVENHSDSLNNNHIPPDKRDKLPASSTYYKTSASKGKILSLMKEKLAEGEIQFEELETNDEINRKKMELILSIQGKLDDLNGMKGLLDVEMKENENLGRQVHNLTKTVCSPKEHEKYNFFVQDVDKIINLLLSLSGRLARVENAIQMLPQDAEKQEMNLLIEKRTKLMEQHKEAKQLKENIDRRQKAVSEILAHHFDHEQFADYEHYIKMKSALIMERRELDDKTKLGREQMQCLRDSLPDEWQTSLDKLLGE